MNRSQRLGATAAATAALLGGAGAAAVAATRGDGEPAPAVLVSGKSASYGSGVRVPQGAAEAALAELDAEIALLNGDAEDLRSELAVASRLVDAANASRSAAAKDDQQPADVEEAHDGEEWTAAPSAPAPPVHTMTGASGSSTAGYEDDERAGDDQEKSEHEKSEQGGLDD